MTQAVGGHECLLFSSTAVSLWELPKRKWDRESVFTRQHRDVYDEYSVCGTRRPIHTTDQKSGVSACPSFFIRHRGTSEVGLVPPITSVFRRQNSATQCAHEGSICVGGCVSRVHVHGKRTGARSKSEKATENIERHCQKRPTVFSFQICFLGSA